MTSTMNTTSTMKPSILIVTSLLVLGSLNWLIVGKERALRSGRTVLCKLAPLDPRSIMQGDYMVLRYEVTEAAGERVPEEIFDGHLVLSLDADNVATFQRVDDETPLAANEVRVRFRRRSQSVRWGLQIGAESYFFQEGRAEHFEDAKYGELKVAPDGECILIGVRDIERQPL